MAELRAAWDLINQRGLNPPRSMEEYVWNNNPGLLQFEHGPKLCTICDRITTGDLTNVLVFAPPRYMKSEWFSRQLPGYFLRCHPKSMVGLASYGADLAWELSEEARGNYVESGGTLRSDASAKKRWGTSRGGEMWAAGVGGPMLGRGFHLGVIDDPVDPEQAMSPTYQRRFTRWFPSKFLSRREPGARILMVAQRLGTEDPADFLLRREVGENTELAPLNWHVVVLDEVHSDEPLGRWKGPKGLPPTCTLEPDWREVGDLLAPSRFDPEAVESMRQSAGLITVSSQRQQRPMRPSGDFWRKTWFRTYKELPPEAYDRGQDWDTAYGEDEKNSASARIESFRGPGELDQFPIFINDVDWDWLEFPALVERMKTSPGPHYIEGKASGKSAKQTLGAHGVAALEVSVKGNKMARASAVQPVVTNRRIFVREEILDLLLFGEKQGLLRVTAERLMSDGKDLDVNDTFVQAITRHLGIHDPAKKKARWR